MTSIEIKKVSLTELEELQKISIATFMEAFADSNSEQNMKMYLEESFPLSKLRTELKNPFSEFYFAVLNDEIIGYLKVNFSEAQSELKEENSLEIERIYVLKDFHGRKVGQILFEKAIQLAKEKQVEFVWLGVWEKNPRAIGFYKKNSFVEFDKHLFKLGDEEQTDIMMKLKL
ncbi:GNAT family N-acetyltransferase [Shivajiella indica]|uniref:GNAT family N-acetyltransferase n=1 Tax=Shivajiella indica TaxID=872115 RepID=A0ABW5B556_9BACT